MKFFILFLTFFFFLQFFSFANPYNSNNNETFFENIIVIKTKENQKININNTFECKELNQLLNNLEIVYIKQKFCFPKNRKASFNDEFGLNRIYEIKYSNNISPLKLSKLYTKSNLIEYANPIYKPVLLSIPNDSLFTKQIYLNEINASNAWDITAGDSSIVIAIIDTEIDNLHVDLINNIWQNQGECGIDNEGNDKRFNGIDDDSNGKIDDWHGWDFYSDVTYEEEQQGIIREDNDTRLNAEYSNFFHGTNVAGAASASTNNKTGVSSIGYNTKILPIKVQSDYGIGWRASEGILYAAVLGADIINCSWLGLGRTDFEFDVIRQVNAMGCLIVAGAGNSSSCINEEDTYIRNSKYVMYVGGTEEGKPADLSNFGIPITTYAPAISILTTSPNNKYEALNGTSLSTPICSGIAALIKSIHKNWDPEQIRHQIRSSSDSFPQSEVIFDRKNFFGKVNSYAALKHNRDDFNDDPVSGIECINFSSENGSDTLNSYSNVIFKFTFKNHLAEANNIEIKLETLDSLIEIQEELFSLVQIKNNEEKSIEVLLKGSEKAKWYSKNSKMLITIKADNYINYQLLSIPLNLAPRNEYFAQLNQIVNSSNLSFENKEITNISSPSINCLWGAGFTNEKIPFFFLNNEKEILIYNEFENYDDEFSEIMIEGISNYSAIICMKRQSSSFVLLLTQNQGNTWQQINLNSSNMWNLNKIHFFNEKFGIMLANTYFTPFYQIILSRDGGMNWEQVSQKLTLKESEFLQLQNTFTQYEHIIIPTNKSRFFISTDYGNNWELIGSVKDFNISKFYVNKNTAFSFCSDSNSSFLAFTEDFGYYWKSFSEKSFFEYFDYPISISGANTNSTFMLINEKYDFLITNSEFEFFPLNFSDDIHKTQILSQNQIEVIQSANKSRVWFVCNGIHYFDLDNIFNPIDSVITDDCIKTLAYPNPLFGNSAYFQIYLTKEKVIKLELFNSIGQVAKTIYNSVAPANQYFTIQWSSSSLPSGKYFYQLTIDGKVYTKPLVIVR